MTDHVLGFPPKEVRYTLRLEGIAAAVGAITAYAVVGGNWWLFALLILAPDLSMLGMLAGERLGSRTYNLAHTYVVPALLAAMAWFGSVAWLMPVALIWIAHIGVDRALGYGLKYDAFKATHLGWIGKKSDRGPLANAS
jgi:hypothetical protein